MHLSSGIITTNHRLRAVAVIRLRMATPAGCRPRSTGLEHARMDNAISMSEWCKGRVIGASDQDLEGFCCRLFNCVLHQFLRDLDFGILQLDIISPASSVLSRSLILI